MRNSRARIPREKKKKPSELFSGRIFGGPPENRNFGIPLFFIPLLQFLLLPLARATLFFEMPRRNASGKTRALGHIDGAYARHLTHLKRVSSLLNKVAELSILTNAHIFFFVQSKESVFSSCFTTNRQGDARAHLEQLRNNWTELEKTTRVYNTLDHINIKQGDSAPLGDVADGQGAKRGRKAQKKIQGQDAPGSSVAWTSANPRSPCCTFTGATRVP